MKRNRFLNMMLLAALVFGLGMSVTSCKDDNDSDGKSEEQKEQEAQEKASKFWDVVAQLVSVDDVTDDYAGKTFEPTIGIADSSDPLTRIVNTNDMKTAAQRFANLVGANDIDENTPSYTWSDPEVGTMTYTRGGTAAEWATVDVDIKAVPHLQKIIYRVGGEGDNGSFEGRAYYRFGDVVSRQVTVTYNEKKNNDRRGTITEYWICVRPAFGPEGKEDSHWVCVNTVGDKNYKYYKASTGKEYWLPTSLGTDKENMQNFAELLYAICCPSEWFNNVLNFHEDGTLWGFSGLPFFTDFKGKNLKYHNKHFWKNVQDGWEMNHVVEDALNLPNLGDFMDKVSIDGIRLLYKGYSWWFTTSWNCELWEAVYTNGTTNAEKNLHHAVYNEEVERNMKDLTFDVRTMGQTTGNYKDFFNNDGKYRWVIRHATGKELASNGKFDVQQPIQGVTEVYRYYTQYPGEWTRQPEEEGKPEITQGDDANNDPAKWNKSDYKGKSHYTIGDIYRDENGHKWYVAFVSGDYQTPSANPANQEYSPYTELISFEGFNFTADGKCATNLPTRDQVIHSIPFLQHLFIYAAAASKKPVDQWPIGQLASYGYIVGNLLDYMDFEIRDYFQRVLHPTGNEREDYYMASIAYKDGSTDKQRLLRYVGYDEVHTQPYKYYLWDHYVANPDSTTILYTANQYSQEPIYLQDVTDLTKVEKYAPDLIARRPLSRGDDMVQQEEAKPSRHTRTTTDDRNAKASNCVYNRATWFSRSFVCDMWNSPVLMYRLTRVYDRGDSDYANRTVDGHTLTLLHARQFPEGWDKADIEDAKYSNWLGLFESFSDFFVDGVSIQHPTWRTVW